MNTHLFAPVIFGLAASLYWGSGDFSGELASRRAYASSVVLTDYAVGVCPAGHAGTALERIRSRSCGPALGRAGRCGGSARAPLVLLGPLPWQDGRGCPCLSRTDGSSARPQKSRSRQDCPLCFNWGLRARAAAIGLISRPQRTKEPPR
jgi:hypothetical protein